MPAATQTDKYQPSDFVLEIEAQIEREKTELNKNSRRLTLAFRAAIIAEAAHAGQKRSSDGQPYTVHTTYVANGKGFSQKDKACGHLHDVLEKTRLTSVDLKYLKIPEDVIEDIELLSSKHGKYLDKIKALLKSARARKIKRRDIEHNMSDRETFTALLQHKIETGWGHPNRLFAMNIRWDYLYPLADAFIEAATKHKTVEDMNVIDFIQSDHCPENLKNHEHTRHLKHFTDEPIPHELLRLN